MRKKQNIEPLNADGQKHGLWIKYYPNGNLYSRHRYVNGILHGIDEWYHYNGEVCSKIYYKDGKYVYSEWYSNTNRIKFNI